MDAVFIDEGFGSLDLNSLEQAVKVLTDLSGENRMVGIISHVSELKERIEKKVELTKTMNGLSLIHISFQAISYVVDVYRQKGEVQRNPLNVGLYITFFPQLIAGPIVRYETISWEIENRQENARDLDVYKRQVYRIESSHKF